MNVTITARHCTLPDAVVRRTHDRLLRLERYEPRLLAADVVYEQEHGVHKAEGRLTIAGGPVVFARATHPDGCGAALDRMVERLRRQLKTERERHRDHRAIPLTRILTPAGGV